MLAKFKKRNSAFVYFICFILSFGLIIGCPREPRQPVDPVYSPESVQFEVGVHASGSMIGFVQKNAQGNEFLDGTLYGRAIDSLKTLLESRSFPTRYWRIGDKEPEPITASQFLDAKHPKFYDCRKFSEYACVASALHTIYELPTSSPAVTEPIQDSRKNTTSDSQPPPLVRILITDLGPDKSAISELSSRISEEMRNRPDYKTLLIGIRSQFNGHVFSTSTSKISIPNYSTEGKDLNEIGRPFYLLMTGPSTVLDDIASSFQSLPTDASRSFRVSSFGSTTSNLITLDDNTASIDSSVSCLARSGRAGKLRPAREEANQWLFLNQRNCPPNPISLTIASKQSMTLLGASFSAEQFNSSNSIIKVEEASVDKSSLTLKTAIQTGGLSARSGQIVYLTLPKEELDKAIWADWNSEPGKAQGFQTENLLLFVSSLRNALKGNLTPEPASRGNKLSCAAAGSDEAVRFCIGISS